MADKSERTYADLHRAVCSISRHFNTETIFIIGSQSILLKYPDAPALMRTSGEIDAYPGNAEEWEADHADAIASEEINALFGIGSAFHQSFGFYIDGVDKNTAKFPTGWEERSTEKVFVDGDKKIRVVAPSLEDLIVSKLHRLDPKDKEFVDASRRVQTLNIGLIKARLIESGAAPEIIENAIGFLESL